MKEFKDLFVDSDEQQLTVLGGGYIVGALFTEKKTHGQARGLFQFTE